MRLRLFRDWPGWRQVGLAAGLGLVIGAGQVPISLRLSAIVALAALLALLSRARTPGQGAWLALFAGAVHFGLALNWIVQPFFVDPWTYGWMAPFAVVFLSFGLALFWALAAAVALRARWRIPALVVALALADLARGHVLTGFPWALFGHIPLGAPVEHLAALIGGYGLGALVLAAAGLAAAAPRAGSAARHWRAGAAFTGAHAPDAIPPPRRRPR